MPKKQIKSPEPLKGKFLRIHEGRVSTNQDRPLFGLEYIDASDNSISNISDLSALVRLEVYYNF